MSYWLFHTLFFSAASAICVTKAKRKPFLLWHAYILFGLAVLGVLHLNGTY